MPSRCGWRCSSSPGAAPARSATAEQRSVAVAVTASAGGRELSQRLAKVETAISRRKTIEFGYYSIERDEHSKRKVDPYHLLYQGGQFYLVGHSHERDDIRVFRLSRIREKISYASKAEHDFSPPDDFDPWAYAHRADWQLGPADGTARIWISERIAWLVERDFGRYGKIEPVKQSGKQWRAGSAARARARRRVHDRVRRAAPARRLGARPRRARQAARARGAGRGGVTAARAAGRAPLRDAGRLRRQAGAGRGAARSANGAADRPRTAPAPTTRRRSAPSASRG